MTPSTKEMFKKDLLKPRPIAPAHLSPPSPPVIEAPIYVEPEKKGIFTKIRERRERKEKEALLESEKVVEKPSSFVDLEDSEEPVKKGRRAGREKPFSEAHPNFYSGMSSILPKTHSIIFFGFIAYLMLKEMMMGNYDFILDWYYLTPIPDLMDLVQDKEAFTIWLKANAMIISVVLISIVILLWMFHKFVWRLFFKDYILIIKSEKADKTELTEVQDGRVYWHNRNMFYSIWMSIYGGPKPPLKAWVHQKSKFWFNIFNPAQSCVEIRMHEDEYLEQRGVYQVLAHERPRRRRFGRRQYETMNDTYTTVDVPLDQSTTEYMDLNSRLVTETRELTKGNATLRLEQMRDGGFIINEKVRRIVINDAKRKGEITTGPDSGPAV
jgi:hypothetical protein